MALTWLLHSTCALPHKTELIFLFIDEIDLRRTFEKPSIIDIEHGKTYTHLDKEHIFVGKKKTEGLFYTIKPKERYPYISSFFISSPHNSSYLPSLSLSLSPTPSHEIRTNCKRTKWKVTKWTVTQDWTCCD
jgi:hypothetical protein